MNLPIIFFLMLLLAPLASDAAAAADRENSDPKAVEATRKRVQQLEETQRRLLEQISADIAAQPPSENRAELQRKLAEIKQQSGIEEGTIKLGLARDAKGGAAKRYLKEIDTRIEDCGTEHFPRHDGAKLYGKGIFSFAIDRAGLLVSQKVVQSSGNAALDQHVAKLIQAAAPFGPVPLQIHKNAYTKFILERRFTFLKDGSAGPLPQRRCLFED